MKTFYADASDNNGQIVLFREKDLKTAKRTAARLSRKYDIAYAVQYDEGRAEGEGHVCYSQGVIVSREGCFARRSN
jgi:hypothetical protein